MDDRCREKIFVSNCVDWKHQQNLTRQYLVSYIELYIDVKVVVYISCVCHVDVDATKTAAGLLRRLQEILHRLQDQAYRQDRAGLTSDVLTCWAQVQIVFLYKMSVCGNVAMMDEYASTAPLGSA